MKRYKNLYILFFMLIPAACGFLFFGCNALDELFHGKKEPPKFMVKNYSATAITSVEFWRETPEYNEAAMEWAKTYLLWCFEPVNPERIAELLIVTGKRAIAQAKLVSGKPDIIDTRVIGADSSRSWSFEENKTYFIRLNGSSSVKEFCLDKDSITFVFTDDGWVD